MAKLSRLAGSTGHVLVLFIQDTTSTTGAGLTGLAFNTAGLTCYYKRNTASASVAVTLATITTLGTYVSGGFKEIDAANLPGFYEFHPPDAAYAGGAKSVAFLLKGAANMAPTPLEVELTAVDNQSATAFVASVPAVAGDVAGKVLGGGSGTITGVGANANAVQSAGVAVPVRSGTLAGATTTTVTFPAADDASNAVPDDGRYAYTVLFITAGTGAGQFVLLTTKTVTARQYGVLAGTMPVTPDNTSRYSVLGSWLGNAVQWGNTPVGGMPVSQGTGANQINLNSGKVAGVVQVDVLSTYTGNTPQSGDVYQLMQIYQNSFPAATVTAVTSATVFTVQFLATTPAASSVANQFCKFTSADLFPAMIQIQSAVSAGTGKLTLTLASAAPAAPQVNDTVLIG